MIGATTRDEYDRYIRPDAALERRFHPLEARELTPELLSLADERGSALERFSIGTYKALEAMGLGLERLVTGNVTERPPLAKPDSVRRREEADPATRLTEAHRDRLLVEDRLRAALVLGGFVLDAEQVKAAVPRRCP